MQVYGDRKNTARQKMYIHIPKHTVCYLPNIKEPRTTTSNTIIHRIESYGGLYDLVGFSSSLKSMLDDMEDGSVWDDDKENENNPKPKRNPDPSLAWIHNRCWIHNLWITQSRVLTSHQWLVRLRNKIQDTRSLLSTHGCSI